MTVLLKTERLLLREWELGDTEALIQIADQPHITVWLPDWRDSKNWAAAWISKVQRHYDINDPMTHFLSWAVVLTESGRIIGLVSSGADSFKGKELGIGYFIDESCRNKGYITEAAAALTEYLFESYRVDHISAVVQPKNAASNTIIKKLGFSYISTVELLESGQPAVLPFNCYRLNNPYK
jgi:RimJ/RimL family protein N-acetyltransferase